MAEQKLEWTEWQSQVTAYCRTVGYSEKAIQTFDWKSFRESYYDDDYYDPEDAVDEECSYE